MKKLIEAALFISGRALTVEDLKSISGAEPEEIKSHIQEIKKEYEERNAPIELLESMDGYKFGVKSEYLPKVKDLAPQMDMGRALVRILSFVAYKQPIKQSDLVKRFGNRVYDYVKELRKRGLIRTDKHKRTKMLTTTRKLLDYLGEEDIKNIQTALKKAEEYRADKKDDSSKEFKKIFKTRRRKKKKTKIPEKDLDVDDWSGKIKKEDQKRKLKMMDELDGGRKRGRKKEELEDDLDIILDEED
ncbi:MAG: SMC-Scp complex subunit ScpB [Candidatus Undinarchaeales archaeon]